MHPRKDSLALRLMAKTMRKNLTAAERIVWNSIRRGGHGRSWPRVHRKAIVLGCVVDFWIPKANLVIELDQTDFKARREEMEAVGIETLMIDEKDVFSDLSSVLSTISETVYDRICGT